MSLALLASLSAAAVLAQPPARVPSRTGDLRRIPGFTSQALGGRRDVTVYLPPRYTEEPRRRYPVLYMADGQNVFDGATSYIPNAEWRADETAEAMIRAGLVEPLIIVAIDNGGAERANEYLPTRASWGQNTAGGKADLFAKMLFEELKPRIDREFRTKPGADDTGFCGSSFGGVLTLHLGLTYSNRVRRIGVLSPSLWWDNGVMLKRIDALPARLPLKIWIDMGTNEGGDSASTFMDAAAALRRKGWRDGRDLVALLEPLGEHNEPAWARRFGEILAFLYPARR